MTSSDDPTYAAGAAVRWSRAVLLCVVGLGSGLVAHVSAGGLLPGPTAFVVLFVIGTLGCATFLGRPASTGRVIALVVAGQTVVHGTLTALSGHRGDPPIVTAARAPAPTLPAPATHLGSGRRGSYFELAYSGGHPARTDVPITLPAPVQHLLADMTGPHAVMALAHLAAAVVVGLWLASGERALWAILTVLRETTRAVVTAGTAALAFLQIPTLAPVPARLAADDLGPPALPRLARTVVRRGPPLLLAG